MLAVPSPAELTGRRIALFSVAVGILLSILKIGFGLAAGSTAVVSDGVEAAADVLSSGMVYFGLWMASKPPDDDHPYGHGRYETLAGLAVGGMLFLTGTAIFLRNLWFMSDQHHVRAFALYPLAAAVVVKVVLAGVKFQVGGRIASFALQADAWHDLTDLISTSVALVAVILTLFNPVRFASADHVGGMAIGIIIFFLSVRVVRQTVDQLVDTMPGEELMTEIRGVAMKVPGAVGIEKCYARRTGLKYHVDLHLEVNPELTVRESHEIATRVRINIKETLGWVADVLVHVEPSPVAVQLQRS